jgi:hypothetical protein
MQPPRLATLSVPQRTLREDPGAGYFTIGNRR